MPINAGTRTSIAHSAKNLLFCIHSLRELRSYSTLVFLFKKSV